MTRRSFNIDADLAIFDATGFGRRVADETSTFFDIGADIIGCIDAEFDDCADAAIFDATSFGRRFAAIGFEADDDGCADAHLVD